jgi:hypothetical protein
VTAHHTTPPPASLYASHCWQPSQCNGCRATQGGITQTLSSARRINAKRHPALATGPRVSTGECFPSPAADNAPRAATMAALGQIRAKNRRYLSAHLAHARRTRPTIQHIPDFQNPGFLLKGSARDCNV